MKSQRQTPIDILALTGLLSGHLTFWSSRSADKLEAIFVSMANILLAQEKSGGSRIGPRGGSLSSIPPTEAKHSRVNFAKFRG